MSKKGNKCLSTLSQNPDLVRYIYVNLKPAARDLVSHVLKTQENQVIKDLKWETKKY